MVSAVDSLLLRGENSEKFRSLGGDVFLLSPLVQLTAEADFSHSWIVRCFAVAAAAAARRRPPRVETNFRVPRLFANSLDRSSWPIASSYAYLAVKKHPSKKQCQRVFSEISNDIKRFLCTLQEHLVRRCKAAAFPCLQGNLINPNSLTKRLATLAVYPQGNFCGVAVILALDGTGGVDVCRRRRWLSV